MAGALSMAIGEYTSVSSQRDAEQADIAKERVELATTPDRELRELTRIYIDKGLDPDLAHEVAVELSQGDVLAVHMAEELGLTHETLARPGQAAWSSAASFSVGALIPLVAVLAVRLVCRPHGWSPRRWPRWPAWPPSAPPALPSAGRPSVGPPSACSCLGGLAMATVALLGLALGTAVG